MIRALFLFLLLPSAAWSAATVQPLTPLNTSVLGGEIMPYAVRLLDSQGRPSGGEVVTFSNDACGFFDNGGFSVSIPSDATGTAIAWFRARAQGITCQVVAQAGGATARFNVLTYTIGQVALTASVAPAEPRPGEPFTVTARANAGIYPIYGPEFTARAIPAGAASIAPVPNGSDTARDFRVTPVGTAPFQVELGFKGLTRQVALTFDDSPYQDMWWGGSAENGWGMSVVQHGDRLFPVIYAYDAAGAPTWFVMPGGTWNAARSSFTGALYSPRGTPFSAYDAAKLQVGAPVGSATISFSGMEAATLDYEIGGIAGRKAVARQPFGPPESIAAPVEAGDMWWGGPAQNGWGIALLQQYRTLFGVWFTYDASGAPTWFVMPSGYWATGSSWEGRLYRTTGSPWVGRPYDPSLLRGTDVGSFSFRFEGGAATFTYTVDGKPGTMALMRQGF